MNEEMTRKNSTLKMQHAKGSGKLGQFRFWVCREATYQKNEEIFKDYKIELGQGSKRAVYLSRP